MSKAVRSPAPVMAGIANRNENLAASFPDIPRARLVLMVIPERETPGMMATACASPIRNPLLKFSASLFLVIFLYLIKLCL